MMMNTKLIHAVADALIETHGQDGTDWFGCGRPCSVVERGGAD